MSASRRLWWRSVRRRRAAALGLLLIVVGAVASAVAGPLLIRASQQSALRAQLAHISSGRFDIVTTASLDNQPVIAPAQVMQSAAGVATGALYDRPIVSEQADQPVHFAMSAHDRHAARGLPTTLIDGCRPLPILAGSCPSAPGQILLPADPAHVPHGLGRRVRFPGSVSFPVVRVAGYYDASATSARRLRDGGVPALLLDEKDLRVFTRTITITARNRLRDDALTLDRLGRADRLVDRVTRSALAAQLISDTSSGVTTLVAELRSGRRVATVLGLLVIVPVVLLSWYAVVLVMQLIAVVRASEWALGRLRGLRLGTWVRSLCAEPAALLVAGTVLGAALGVLVARVTVTVAMAAGTTLEPFRPPVYVALAGTVLGAATGVATAIARGVRMPLAALLQESAEPPRVSRTGAVMQALLVAVAVLAIVQLRTQARLTVGAANLGLLLPGLLAMILTLVAIRAWTYVVRRGSARPPASVAALVLGRRLARTPGLLWRYSTIAVATALALFAVQLIVLMNRNVVLRAGAVVGAAQVLHVAHVPTPGLLAAVEAADPSGRHAMAAEEIVGVYASGTSRLVAVDASRLAAVSSWHASWAGTDGATLARRLAPPHRRSVVVRGTQLHLGVDGVALATAPTNVDPAARAPVPEVVADVQRGSTWQQVDLGPLHPHTRELSGPMPCARGCTLRRLRFHNQTDTQFTGDFLITSLSTNAQPASTFAATMRDPRAWQDDLTLAEASLPVSSTIGRGENGLHLQIQDLAGQGSPAIIPADGPSPQPVLLARDTAVSPFAGVPRAINGADLDGQSRPVAVVGRASVLPRSIHDGVLVDLRSSSRLSDPAGDQAGDEVWLAAGTPPEVLAALHRSLRVTGTERAADSVAALTQAAPPRAVAADAVLVALLGLLAVTALAAGFAIDAGRRRRHLRVLHDAGLDDRTVRAFALREAAAPAVAAVVLGACAALVTVLLAGTHLPLFADDLGPPLATTPAWGTFLLSFGAALVGVTLVAVLLALAEHRAAVRSTR